LDWDEVAGSAACEGDLRGTLAAGGDWTGRCKSNGNEWGTSLTWKLHSQ
jgi:hypothetical protein